MKAGAAIVAILALVAGFLLGRVTAPVAPDPERPGVDSFRRALADPDWLTRSQAMSAYLQDLGPDDLPQAIEAFDEHLPWLITEDLRLFMLAWSRFDAPAALAHALSRPRLLRRNSSGAAIYAWAFRDPEGAVAALETAPAELRDFLDGRLIAGWAHRTDREGIDEYIASRPVGPGRASYIGTLAWEISKEGPEAVMRWAEGVPDVVPIYKEAVFAQAVTTLAALDPEATVTWIEPHLGRPYASEAARVTARSWATHDPRASVEWATDLPPSEDRTGAVVGSYRTWLDRAPDEAEAWLRARVPDATLDPAVRVMVQRNARKSPAVALAWAEFIGDPGLRRSVRTRLARTRAATGRGAQGDGDGSPANGGSSEIPTP